jgi:uncharacterized membrane protein YphA (DoxX/SURF4 family)
MARDLGDEPKTWEQRIRDVALVIGRLALAYLFFTQLWWKTPPTFGCPSDFAFTTAGEDGRLHRTTGLCDWLGVESVWAKRPHPIFAANLDNQGGPELKVDIGLLSRINGFFIDNVVKPNIRWMGWILWGSEAFIFLTLFFGVFSRLGSAVAIAVSAQLFVGLSGISDPYEWEWSYNLILVLSILMFAFAPGRVFGIDRILRTRLKAQTDEGGELSRYLLWLM